jgi:hypothetical protein
MFDNFQTPVGTIPIGFQELVSLFPFIISILFLFLAYKVEDLMSSESTEIDSESTALKLIYDPYKEKKSQKLKISLLFIPIIVFVFSFALIVLVYFSFDEPSTDRDDPFRAAIDFNKLISVIMSVIGSIFMGLALRKLFLNPRISPRVVATNPGNSDHDVSVAATISVVFDTAMDESTLVHQTNGIPDRFTISLKDDKIKGNVTLDHYNYTLATFTPTRYLESGAKYKCKITQEVKDRKGFALVEEKNWSFNTK